MPYIDEIEAFMPSNPQEENDKIIILEYISKFSDTILTRDNRIAHMTSSGLILNPSLDKILMIHHNIYKTWAWTGGHADGERDMLFTAVKEAKEETGVVNIHPLSNEIASLDILPVYGHFKNKQYVSAHLHLNVSYALVAEEHEALRINVEETSGVQWIPVPQLDKFSNEPYLIDVYMKIVDWARNQASGSLKR